MLLIINDDILNVCKDIHLIEEQGRGFNLKLARNKCPSLFTLSSSETSYLI